MTDAWRYAVWPDPRSRSRSWALESRKFGHFQRLSPPPFTMGAGKWPRILKLGHNTYSLPGPDFWFFSEFLCHMTLKLALSRSRPSVPYGANLLVMILIKYGVCHFKIFLCRGLVPLHNACSYGHFEVTELLLKVRTFAFFMLKLHLYLWELLGVFNAVSAPCYTDVNVLLTELCRARYLHSISVCPRICSSVHLS